MTVNPRGLLIRLTIVVFMASSAIGHAKDVPGAKDHPLVGRYAGSEISFYVSHEFDRTAILRARPDNAGVSAAMSVPGSGSAWSNVEGRVTQVRYDEPAGRSSLEIIRNLRSAMTDKGFEILFSCDDAGCFAGSQNDPYILGWIVDGAQNNGRYADHARYLLAHLSRPQGDVYVALIVGEAHETATAFVKVVEEKPMETGKVVFVDASAMSKALDAAGKVALYGIQFDTDKDTMRPESKPTVEEIARLMTSNPDLKLIVTGHADNQGAFDYNVDLSRRRAASIVATLTGQYGVARDRLTPFGAGMAAPVASNATEVGRAKNRRVELVAR